MISRAGPSARREREREPACRDRPARTPSVGRTVRAISPGWSPRSASARDLRQAGASSGRGPRARSPWPRRACLASESETAKLPGVASARWSSRPRTRRIFSSAHRQSVSTYACSPGLCSALMRKPPVASVSTSSAPSVRVCAASVVRRSTAVSAHSPMRTSE